MDRRRFLILTPLALGSLGATAFLAGCRQDGPLRVSYHPWIGYETFLIADQLHWLPEAVSVTRRESASASLDALRADRADAAALTLDEVIRARAQGLDLQVVLVFNVSAGADALLAGSSIRDIASLAGRRVGVETSGVGGMLLDRILEQAGLERDELEIIDLPVNRHLEAWRDRQVDALVSYEPTASLIEQDGARRLLDSRDFPDTIFDVLAVRRDRIDGAQETLRALIAAHFRALDHLRTNRQDAVYRISEAESVGPDVVRRALGGVRLPNRLANDRYLAAESRFTAAADQLQQLLVGEVRLSDGWYSGAYLPPERIR
ncbi:MAG: ABC transporter substrate-binding protein [Guyparkeria sp.]|uniref:ABC transporter substrate-binding protein n=1 Tax=Guyparkeria sp. TaxID=2035736 RepID=UPI0039780A7C